MGGSRMGTGYGSADLCGDLAVYRTPAGIRSHGVTPKYVLAGGVIGALITYTVIRSMAALGPARTSLLIVVAQIIVAYLIELFGLFGVEKAPFAWNKLLGAAIAVGGIIIFQR